MLGTGHDLIEKSEELVDLFLWKVGIVTGILHLKSVDVRTPTCHHVRQGMEARVAHRHSYSVEAIALKFLD